MILALSIFLSIFVNTNASASDAAQLALVPSVGTIEGLRFSRSDYPVISSPQGNSTILEGRFERPGWSLLIHGTPITLKGGAFRLRVLLLQRVNVLQFRAVGPLGQVEKQVHTVTLPQAQMAKRPGRLDTGISLGYSSFDYRQTGYPDLSMSGLTVKVMINYGLPENRWDLGLTAFGTALTFAATPSDISARFIGFNLRAGYRISNPLSLWKFSIRAGVYYNTMIVSGSNLGYSNQLGPQLYPELVRKFAGGQTIGGYFKFSPIADGVKLLSLSNREIAGGLNYQWPVGANSDRRVGIAVDGSQLQLVYSTAKVTLSTATLSLGYSF